MERRRAARHAADVSPELTAMGLYPATPSAGRDVVRGRTVVTGAVDRGWSDATEYAQDKRGAEMATGALLARTGLILGPYEDVGRPPYWLLRIERRGEVLAPGPAEVPLRYIDARDLVAWLLAIAS